MKPPQLSLIIAGLVGVANSSAAATGQLKKDQLIEIVNGHVLKGEDPRVLLGNWITEAEANGGIVKLMVKDTPEAAARDAILWDYTTFDPPEEKPWENGHRFRKVTVPHGSENWFTPAFDPKSAPGWKSARAPFAHGEILLAANGFLRWGHKIESIKSYQAFWFEEMKLPELPSAPK